MSKNHTIQSLHMSDTLEKEKKIIIQEWLASKNIKNIFKSYKISLKKFEQSYAFSILEYFIETIRLQREEEGCPVMEKMIYFLLERGATPKDIFDICTALKRAVLHRVFKKYVEYKNIMELIDEVSDMFDKNLSSLLKIFTDEYKKRELKIFELTNHHKKLNQILQIINFVNTKIFIIQNEHVILANKPFLQLLGVANMLDFNKKYLKKWDFLHNVLTQDNIIFDTQNIQPWLQKVYRSNKAFRADIYNHKYAQSISYNGRITILPDTNPTKYIITLNAIQKPALSTAEINNSIDKDLLSGFYNYPTFEHLLGERQRDAQEKGYLLALVIVDLPELQSINEDQSREAGDIVLKEIANDIKDMRTTQMSIARLEGSRFGILMPYDSEQECYDWCNTLNVLLNKKPERKTVSVTSFDLFEKVNRVLMRAYDLADLQNESQAVRTDFENIEIIETLPYQKKFTTAFLEGGRVDTSLYYKNLPVNSKNLIVKVYSDNIIVHLSSAQTIVSKYNQFIFFKHPSFGNIKASLQIIDVEKNLAKIDKFRADKYSPLEREKLRVDAEDNMYVQMISGGPLYKGLLIDINEEAFALRIKKRANLQEGSFVSVNMMIDIKEQRVQFNANAIVYRIEKIKDAYKIVLKLQADTDNLSLLSSYIASRQIEIIQELKSFY